MAKRLRKNKVQYFLKWKGYDKSENSWEPENNLNCKDLIRDFEKKFKQEKKVQSKFRRGFKLCNSTFTSHASSKPKQWKISFSSKSKKKTVKTNKADLNENNDKFNDNESCVSEDELSSNVSETTPVEKTPDYIIGAHQHRNGVMFLLKWDGVEEADLILAEHANLLYPQVVIKFYESCIRSTNK